MIQDVKPEQGHLPLLPAWELPCRPNDVTPAPRHHTVSNLFPLTDYFERGGSAEPSRVEGYTWTSVAIRGREDSIAGPCHDRKRLIVDNTNVDNALPSEAHRGAARLGYVAFTNGDGENAVD